MKIRANDPRLLYFTKTAVVTDDEANAAYVITHNVGFRNGAAKVGDVLEKADAVAGYPPVEYQRAYFVVRTAAELIKAKKDRDAGRKPETDDEPEAEIAEEPITDLTIITDTEDYKSGFAAGKLRVDYGDPTKVSENFKLGYEAGLKEAPAEQQPPPPPPPPTPPVWGKPT